MLFHAYLVESDDRIFWVFLCSSGWEATHDELAMAQDILRVWTLHQTVHFPIWIIWSTR